MDITPEQSLTRFPDINAARTVDVRGAEHSRPECDQTQRKNDESGEEQRVEHRLDAVPHQHQCRLILLGHPRSVIEIGERGGRDVWERPGREHDETLPRGSASGVRADHALPMDPVPMILTGHIRPILGEYYATATPRFPGSARCIS
jgi:hypothetical protein